MFDLLILGCGYTGERVARRFVSRGWSVTATTRDPRRLSIPGVRLIQLDEVPAHVRPRVAVVHSIPPGGPTEILDLLGDTPRRLVYLSSTGVYGSAAVVDEHTPPDPSTDRARVRLAAEHGIASRGWSSLILRPAAIYGPGRGIHESIRRGSYSLSDTLVSRIHVEDLAAHVEASLLSEVTGAYPVADEEPCTSREIAEFCARLHNTKLEGGHEEPPRFSSNRRVDGSAIRRLLGIKLAYPSYRDGIPAALRST
jgi:nucleoside-diphosphate-sugar epimerase